MPMADEINPQMLGEWLAGMSLPERTRNLNRMSYHLTVCTREFEAATQPFKDPLPDHKDANRPQRITASAFPTDRPLYGRADGMALWKRDDLTSSRSAQ